MNGPPLALSLSNGPYRTSGEHLRDELARADLLIRAQIARWRMTTGAAKPEQLWGMVHVTEAEIDQYLAAPVTSPDTTPDSIASALEPYWSAEARAEEAIRQAIDRTSSGVDLRLERLRTAFHLNDLERDIVLVCLLPEVDFRYRRIFGYLLDDATRTRPTVDLALRIVNRRDGSVEAARALFEPSRALLAHRLVTMAPADSRAASAVSLDDRIASFLLAGDETDTRLRGIVTALPCDVEWDQLFCTPAMLARLRQLGELAGGGPTIVRFHGPHGSGRQKAARAMCRAGGRPLLHVDVEAALRDPTLFELVVDLASREATLLQAATYWDGIERLQQDDQPAWRWRHLLRTVDRAPHLTILASAETSDASRRFQDAQFTRLDFPVPHDDLRRQIWLSCLPADADLPDPSAAAATLAAVFQLTEGQVRDAVLAATALARRRDVLHPRVTIDDLQEACRKQAGRRLLGFARRIEPTRRLTIDDVILGEATKRQLRELLDRVRLRSRLQSEISIDDTLLRGKGLLVLFAGASGTGKTLSAELLANQQGVDLYKVDLSTVVSKWVGETEKNLSRVFAEAEDSDALLFFDECDSLFGQRGQISEARDRWANLQVNYLLQRVEEYAGVVVMATNLRKNIDDAFLRRIQVVIEFPSPDAALRRQIWARMLPAGAAVPELELRAVADRFAFTGGSIRNVSIDAAFRALAAGRQAIVIRDVVAAVAREYQKLGKPITQGDFGDEFYAWAVADVLAPAGRG